MNFTLKELLDIPRLQNLLNALDDFHSMPSAIIDSDGTILTATAWQDICTKFHRMNPAAEQKCIESDRYIEARLTEQVLATGSTERPLYVVYRCPLGLVDSATPIIIEGKHLGNVFTGQLFMEPPDETYFSAQARQYGFDEGEYLAAVRRVPLFSEEMIQKNLRFIGQLAQMLAEQGLLYKRQREAEEILRVSEERHRLTLDAVMDGFWLTDTRGRLLEVNDIYCSMSGYSRQELLTMGIPDLEATERAGDTAAHSASIVALGEDRFVSRHRRKDGSVLDVEVSVQYRPDNGGQFLAFLHDITELKRVEEALWSEKAFLRCIIDSANDLIYFKDSNSRYLGCNKASEAFIGMAESAQIGKSDFDLLDSAVAETCMKQDQAVIANRVAVRAEDWVSYPDGRRVLLDTMKAPIYGKDGHAIGLVGISRDITDRKLMEDALRKSEQHFRSIIESLPVPLAMNDEQGNITFLNSSFIETTGYTLNDIPTLSEWWPRAYPDPLYRQWVIDSWRNSLAEATRTNRPFTALEVNITCLNGSVRTFICSAVSLTEKFTGIHLVFLYDITERKLIEAEKIAIEQQFQQTQKLESLGVLTGGIAHDFNNILQVIIGHCSLAKLKPRPGTVDTHIPEIEKAAGRAADLCRQMLAYAGKATSVSTQINMKSLVDEMVKMLKATFAKNVAIASELVTGLPTIKADASQLRQVVMNLIINAAEAIGEEQGKIGVVLTKCELLAGQLPVDHLGKSIPPGWYLRLEVSDTGCGMAGETKRRLFEPFYTTKFTGRGLGLSATLGIITAHAGALQLTSQPGHGTTFTVYLPIQNSTISDQEDPLQITPPPWQGSGTILLAEDEIQVKLIAKILLEQLGFTVLEASNGTEALALYLTHGADIRVVMTDMGMPVMDGYALFRELKKVNPELPIIISSGFGDTAIAARIARKDIAGLVSKPYSLEVLRNVLQSVLEAHH